MPHRREPARPRAARLSGGGRRVRCDAPHDRAAGSTLVEALVALALTAIGAGVLAAVATAGGRGLVLARHDATATALAASALETERAGPRTGGTDAVASADGTTLNRAWTVVDGRGAPDRMTVAVTWIGHRIDLAAEALP